MIGNYESGSTGVALAEVRDLLGYQSIQVTERYAQLAAENVGAPEERLEATESHLSHVEDIG